MADRLRETMDGTLGHFWMELNDVYELSKSSDGYVKLADDNLFHVGTLRTREVNEEFGQNRDRLPQPEAVYAMTGSTRSISLISPVYPRTMCGVSGHLRRRSAPAAWS